MNDWKEFITACKKKVTLHTLNVPGEPFRARLLTALMVIDSYVTTLVNAGDSFRAFAVSIA